MSKLQFKAGWREIGGDRSYYRSRWEANYARFLEWRRERDEVLDWKHEPHTFWFENIKRGVRSYLPDFSVMFNDGTCLDEYHEVKGHMDSRSATKIKRMRKYYPDVKLVVVDSKQYRQIEKLFSKTVPGWE